MRTGQRKLLEGRLAKMAKPLTRLIKETAGSSLVLVALAMPVVLGMAALGLDATLWYMQKRNMQALADNSVLAGVLALQEGGSPSDIQQAVINHAAYSGFQHGVDGYITANNPPSAGAHSGDADYVEIFVERDMPTMLSVFQRQAAMTVQARAVGSLVSGGNYCVVALGPEKHSIDLNGAVTATLNACAIASNSTDGAAIRAKGDSIVADAMQAVGGIDYDGSVSLTYGPPREGAPAVEDPHADLVVLPDPGVLSAEPCEEVNFSINEPGTIEPGRYCGGMSIGGGAVITFNPGVYLITEGDFDVSAGATLQNSGGGGGVTFIITAENANDIGTFKINGSATVNLTAPGPLGHTYGPHYSNAYPGILVFVDPRSDDKSKNFFNGGSNMQMEGAIYVPNAEVWFAGGANITVGCLQVVAHQVVFTGNSTITSVRDDCGALGVKTAGSHLPRIAE